MNGPNLFELIEETFKQALALKAHLNEVDSAVFTVVAIGKANMTGVTDVNPSGRVDMALDRLREIRAVLGTANDFVSRVEAL